MLKKLDKINKFDDADPGNICTDDLANNYDDTPTDGSRRRPPTWLLSGRGETHETRCVNGIDWTDKKHKADGTSPEHIDLDVNQDRDNSDEYAEVVEDQYFRMNITDATAMTAMLKALLQSCVLQFTIF